MVAKNNRMAERDSESARVARAKEIIAKIAQRKASFSEIASVQDVLFSNPELRRLLEEAIHEAAKKAEAERKGPVVKEVSEAKKEETPLEKANNYLNSVEFKKSEQTLRDIEDGKEVSTEALIKATFTLTSTKDREDRKTSEEALQQELKNMAETAIAEGRNLTAQEETKALEISTKLIHLNIRNKHDVRATAIFGEHKTEEARAAAVIKNGAAFATEVKNNKVKEEDKVKLATQVTKNLVQNISEGLEALNVNTREKKAAAVTKKEEKTDKSGKDKAEAAEIAEDSADKRALVRAKLKQKSQSKADSLAGFLTAESSNISPTATPPFKKPDQGRSY